MPEMNLLRSRFADEKLEREFNQWAMPAYRKKVLLGVGLTSLTWLSFVGADYRIFGISAEFYLLLLLRFWQISLSIFIFYVINKSNSYKLYTRLIFVFWLSNFIAICVINLTRPPDFFIRLVVDIMALLLSYTMIPNRLISQIIPAFFYSAFNIWYSLTCMEMRSGLAFNTIVVAYVVTNIFGAAICWQSSLGRRKRFLTMLELQQTNRELGKALSEIKTLKGIIPICANCKKIRDDQGYWNQLEQYMAAHFDAEFSHGLCPQCAEELYPEITERLKKKKRRNKRRNK